MHGAKATCKRTQQLPILFARQYWELLWQCWWVVCKQLQTLLGPAVHRGKDTTHKTLETMCNARAWPHVGRAVQTDPTLLRYASAITEQKKSWELLAQNFEPFQTLRNNTQQHATTSNMACKRTQHVTSSNVVGCWPAMLHPCLHEAWCIKILHAFFLVSMTCFRLAKHEEPVRRLFFNTLLWQFWHDNSYVINQI